MFRLQLETTFSASHKLEGVEGACNQLHGHTWRVAVKIAGPKLLDNNILVDFHTIKDVIATLDHTHLNAFFDIPNPTAEYIARYLYLEIDALISIENESAHVSSITVWESTNASITYP